MPPCAARARPAIHVRRSWRSPPQVSVPRAAPRYTRRMAYDTNLARDTATQLSIVGAAVRDLGRLRRVALIVARHGFGGLMMRTPLGRRLFDREPPPDGDSALRA